MPSNLPFFGPVQAIISPPVATLTSDQEVIVHQLAEDRIDIRNRVADSSFQEPPFHDSFHGVLGLGVLYKVGEYLISQQTVWIVHAIFLSIRYADMPLPGLASGSCN